MFNLVQWNKHFVMSTMHLAGNILGVLIGFRRKIWPNLFFFLMKNC